MTPEAETTTRHVWQDAIDTRLALRLLRPLTGVGSIRQVVAQRIMRQVQQATGRLPLLTRLALRYRIEERGSGERRPIVVAQPLRRDSVDAGADMLTAVPTTVRPIVQTRFVAAAQPGLPHAAPSTPFMSAPIPNAATGPHNAQPERVAAVDHTTRSGSSSEQVSQPATTPYAAHRDGVETDGVGVLNTVPMPAPHRLAEEHAEQLVRRKPVLEVPIGAEAALQRKPAANTPEVLAQPNSQLQSALARSAEQPTASQRPVVRATAAQAPTLQRAADLSAVNQAAQIAAVSNNPPATHSFEQRSPDQRLIVTTAVPTNSPSSSAGTASMPSVLQRAGTGALLNQPLTASADTGTIERDAPDQGSLNRTAARPVIQPATTHRPAEAAARPLIQRAVARPITGGNKALGYGSLPVLTHSLPAATRSHPASDGGYAASRSGEPTPAIQRSITTPNTLGHGLQAQTADAARPELNVGQLANHVYDLLVRRLADERERRG